MSLTNPASIPQSAVMRTLAIPELMIAVLQDASESDLLCFIQVSRAMFHIAVPLLWRNATSGSIIQLIDFENISEGTQEGKNDSVNVCVK